MPERRPRDRCRWTRRAPWAPLLLGLLLLAPAGAAAQGVPPRGGGLCRAAIAQAEREAVPAMPARLLSAIARVESGRRDPETGQHDPWPWTINAEGRGSYFPDRPAAIAAVRALQARGVRSIDIGCMQVNLRHHPNAFASLEEAFDPLSNARYAVRFLRELHAGPAGGDWMHAASFYHSQTPEHAAAYRGRVVAALAVEQGLPAPPPTALAAFAPSLPASPGAMRLSNRAETVVMRTAPVPGMGRGLDAYRAAPIALTGRLLPATATRIAPTLRPGPLALATQGGAAPPVAGAAPGLLGGGPARGPLVPGLPPRS